MSIPSLSSSSLRNVVVPLIKLHRQPSIIAEAHNWTNTHAISQKDMHYVLTARYKQFSESQEDNYWAAVGAMRILRKGQCESEDEMAPIFAEYGMLLAEDLLVAARLEFGQQLVERELDIEYIREMGFTNDAILVSMVHASER